MQKKLQEIRKAIQAKSNPTRARVSRWFFKTKPGQYGHGDQFLGLTMPEQRQIAKQFRDASDAIVLKLLQSKWHEERMIALLIWTMQCDDRSRRDEIANFYLDQTARINNWDLVDASAHQILGPWIGRNRSRQRLLDRLAASSNLWKRRIAIVTTYHTIKQGDPKPTLRIATSLLGDSEDLIHKATGWMLREVGKNCGADTLRHFLKKQASQMPRTMLRYAIEKFSDTERKHWLYRVKRDLRTEIKKRRR